MAGEACRECPYANECEEGEGLLAGSAHLAADSLSLLKEQEPLLKKQEPKPPTLMQDVNGIWSTCPTCGNKLRAILAMEMDTYSPKYCQECGQAVKWE